jgi:hypothetical protein
MSLRSPPSRRTYAAWQNWLLDRHQRSMHVLHNHLPNIRTVGWRYRSPAENKKPFQQIEADGSQLKLPTSATKSAQSGLMRCRNGPEGAF